MASLFTETITAMSSVFTPGAGCGTSWTYEAQYYNSVSNGLLMQILNQGEFDTACFPDDFDAWGRAPSSYQVYSPGACPSGYATPGLFNNEGTTTAICCQSGFSYATSFSTINFNTGSSVLFLGCISTFSGTTTVVGRNNNSDLNTTVVTGPMTMWGQPISVEYQEKDLSLFGTTTTSSSSTSTGDSSGSTASTSSTSTLTSPTGSSTSSPDQSSSGLSTGAKAGIAVGVVLLVLIAAAVGIFLIMRRRKARLTSPPTPSNAHPPLTPKWVRGELAGDDLRHLDNRQDKKPPQYQHPEQPPVELNATSDRPQAVSELE